MLKLQSIADVTHHLEDVLSELRDNKLTPDGALGNLIHESVEYLSGQLTQLLSAKGIINCHRRMPGCANALPAPVGERISR